MRCIVSSLHPQYMRSPPVFTVVSLHVLCQFKFKHSQKSLTFTFSSHKSYSILQFLDKAVDRIYFFCLSILNWLHIIYNFVNVIYSRVVQVLYDNIKTGVIQGRWLSYFRLLCGVMWIHYLPVIFFLQYCCPKTIFLSSIHLIAGNFYYEKNITQHRIWIQ